MDCVETVIAMSATAPLQAAGVTKLFDVLAEPLDPYPLTSTCVCKSWLFSQLVPWMLTARPKGIVARLLFELGGHRQAVFVQVSCAGIQL